MCSCKRVLEFKIDNTIHKYKCTKMDGCKQVLESKIHNTIHKCNCHKNVMDGKM